MSTDFFQRQSNARRNTIWLVVMFLIAMLLIVAVIFVATVLITQFVSEKNVAVLLQDGDPIRRGNARSLHYGSAAAGIGATIIILGTLYKVIVLRKGGGIGVAENVGGKRAFPNTDSRAERRLLNIVEEMSIASGTPVPPVFVLEETGINAFAAGYSPDDAVIGVTRGAIEQLSREQLQGVIAHEFSHILNGDMRMNIRMIGILHGILLIALTGRMILRARMSGGHRGSSTSGGRGGGVIVIVAIALLMLTIGWIGSFIGGLIKAAVSRQREYLADSSAVQFTRNPNGIADALKRIGGNHSRGLLKHHNASEASHMYFAQGVFEGFTGWMATHPPLKKRILAIDPGWDGKFPGAASAPSATSAPSAASAPAAAKSSVEGSSSFSESSSAPIEVVSRAAEQIGDPQEYHCRYAAELIDQLDADILHAAREPYLARGLMFAILLDRDVQVRESQVAAIRSIVDKPLLDMTMQLAEKTDLIPDRAFLPLVDLALPALAAMSRPQYQTFIQAFSKLTAADSKISLFEWTLGQVLRRHLRPRYHTVTSPVTYYYGLKRLGGELSVLLSTLARVGHTADNEIREAFDSGARCLDVEVRLLSPDECKLVTLDASLRKLERASARLRGTVIDACAAIICADGRVRVREAELLRGIADMLDCPTPPLISSRR